MHEAVFVQKAERGGKRGAQAHTLVQWQASALLKFGGESAWRVEIRIPKHEIPTKHQIRNPKAVTHDSTLTPSCDASRCIGGHVPRRD